MLPALGGLLVAVAALYAGVWAWLRGGFTSLPSPRAGSKEELNFSSPSLPASFLELEAGVSSFSRQKQGLGGEVPAEDNLLAAKFLAAPGLVGKASPHLLFSVLVAARDEAAALPALLAALAAQTLPPACFEVLVADDHSADATAAVVAAATAGAPYCLRLVSLPPGAAGKKAALAAAEAQARAPWVACTDADCRPGPGWLQAYADLLRSAPALHFVSGPVRLTPGGAWFDGLLGLEFAGLVGVGAGCIGRGQPTMCNGANLAYRRATFRAVGGYADNAALASGDDEFLLHKMHQRYPAGIRFLADARAVVDTPAPATLGALLRQRVRWASKYPHYRPTAPRQLALLVLGTNLALALGLVAGGAWPALRPWVAASWALKLGADAWLLGPVLGLLRRRRWLLLLLPLQLLYAPYALAVGLAGRRQKGYGWKGRQVR